MKGSSELIAQATQQVFNVIRLSTRENSDRKNFTPKDTKTNQTFHEVSWYFHPFKVLTKADAGKLGIILAQWAWKPSFKSIGFDAAENGQSRQAHPEIPIDPVPHEIATPCSTWLNLNPAEIRVF
jgi:hypothetical protein